MILLLLFLLLFFVFSGVGFAYNIFWLFALLVLFVLIFQGFSGPRGRYW